MSEDETAESTELAELDANRTWWQRNAIPVMGLVSLVMLVFVIAFQTAC
jgi:predicted negative regulator of RcsB-dependent stress response